MLLVAGTVFGAGTAGATQVIWSTPNRMDIGKDVKATLRVSYEGGSFWLRGEGGRWDLDCVVGINSPIGPDARFQLSKYCNPYNISATFSVSNWTQQGGRLSFGLRVDGLGKTPHFNPLPNVDLSYVWNVGGSDPVYAAEMERQRQAEAERQRQAEIERQRQAELERQRQMQLAAQQAELQRQQQAELQRQQQAELERQRQAEVERQQQAELERQRQIQLAAQQTELERQRQAEIERQRAAEAERQRAEEARRQQQQQDRAAGPTPIAQPEPAAIERECVKRVQGRIAWNDTGDRRWDPANVKRLCGGARVASAPPFCFALALHGGIERGNGSSWTWMDAIDLCAGSSSPFRSIQCFETSITQGVAPAAAIDRCKRPQ